MDLNCCQVVGGKKFEPKDMLSTQQNMRIARKALSSSFLSSAFQYTPIGAESQKEFLRRNRNVHGP